MTAVPVIDRERLDKVCMGKPDMALVFIDSLIEESTPILATLPSAVAAADHSAVREGAHSVKGIAGNIGAPRLQAAAERLETGAKAGAPSAALADALAGVIAALAEVQAEREALS